MTKRQLCIINFSIFLIALLGLPSMSFAEEDTWTTKADMPTGRFYLSTSTVNGKIYVIGGVGGTSTVEEYDPARDTWTTKTSMPTARYGHSTSVVNGKIYVIGGPALLPWQVEEYDPATDKWTKKADMPTARFVLSTSVVNGYIYAIGGAVPGIPPTVLSTVEEYDTGVGIRVTRISPQQGWVTGGEPIEIFGTGFPSGAVITIGGKPLTGLKVTDTLITGVTPPGTEGEQDIWIIVPGLDYSIPAGKFFYYPPSGIVVKEMSPPNGKQAGGGVGSITGIGFLPGATVTIGGIKATDVVVTPALIIFTIPAGTEGAKDVVVINPDGQKGTLRGGYTDNPFPAIESIKPDEGHLAGRTQITITGSHFMQGVAVTIGGERVQRLDFFSPTELRLNTSPGTAGPKDVRVVNPDGQEAVRKEGFTYNPAPTISSVTPNMGPLEGGTEIIITGAGFLPTGVDVLIGGAEVSGKRLVSSTEIKAKTPPSSSGPKDVVVINRDGQEATLENAFTYNRAPAITSVTPDNGKLAGSTQITIQGNGFLPGAEILIGLDIDARAFIVAPSVQVMSSMLITAVTPSGDPGPKDVVVRNPDRQEAKLFGGFTYNPMPKITDISPNHGPASGGTKLLIKGTGFLQRAKVFVGKRAGTTEVKDDSTIEAVTPSNPPGVFDVRVINPDTQAAIKRKGFISVGEMAYNFPNPFRAEQGTTFRYVTNERVESIKVNIFNMRGVPIGVVGRSGSNEVRWDDSSVHVGLYVYLMEVRLEGMKVKRFRNMLEVYK